MVSTISKSNQPLEMEITLEEFLKMPETKPESKYVDGKIYQKPIPQGEHIAILFELRTE